MREEMGRALSQLRTIMVNRRRNQKAARKFKQEIPVRKQRKMIKRKERQREDT